MRSTTRPSSRSPGAPSGLPPSWCSAGGSSGAVVIPQSVHRDRIIENAAIFDFSLSDEDMCVLEALDRTGGTGCGCFRTDPDAPPRAGSQLPSDRDHRRRDPHLPLRIQRVPPGPATSRRVVAGGPLRPRRLPDRSGQEPLLPAAGADARRRDGRRLAVDRADEGSDRLARAPGRRRRAARLEPRSPTRSAQVSGRLRDGSLKLLYVAPERFNNERFLAQLGQTKIALFAVDEAHCISEWGHNFRPDYLKLAARARELGAERVLALTATATPAVVADIRAGFGIDGARLRRHRFLPTEPERCSRRRSAHAAARPAADRPPARARRPARRSSTSRSSARRERIAAAARGGRPSGACLPRGHERRRPCRGAGVVDGLGREHRRRDDRVRDGDRQGRRPLRLPLQPAEGPRVLLAGDRPRRPRRRAVRSASSSPAADDVPTLENFAYGDTPTREAIAGLLDDVSYTRRATDSPSRSTSSRHATTYGRSC